MDLYQQKIMDHYLHPRHQGKLTKADKKFTGQNVSCGDKVDFKVRLDSQGKIKQVAWQGNGCTISQAAASILADMMIGKTIKQVQNVKSDKFLKDLVVELSPARRKCALLPLYTVKEEELE